MNNTRIIRIRIYSSSNLEEVKGGIFDLLIQLNRTFRNRGIEFALADDLSECKDEEIDIALYWQDFGNLPRDKFESVNESLENHGTPSKIFVFFRETNDSIEEALNIFKKSFIQKYERLYSTFEHIDSVKFELAVSFFEYLPDTSRLNSVKNLLTIKDNGDINFEGKSIASMNNLSFARFNIKRKTLIKKIHDEKIIIKQLESDFLDSPDNSDLENDLNEARIRYANFKHEKYEFEQLLLSRAFYFIRESAKEMDERVIKARELFLKGRMTDANNVLDLSEMIEKDKMDSKLFEGARQLRINNIQLFATKAEIVMMDDSISIQKRFAQASSAYENAIRISKEIRFEDEKMAIILLDCAKFLKRFYKHFDSEQFDNKTFILPESFEIDVAMALKSYGLIDRIQNKYEDAEKELTDSLFVFKRLADKNSEAHKESIKEIQENLAELSNITH